MAWVVDSDVLLDIALNDAVFGLASAALLETLRSEDLLVCPISIVELAPQFGEQPSNVRKFLSLAAIQSHVAWTEADTDTAAAGWIRYVSLKRCGQSQKRPIADILIGGFASRFTGLVTRNPTHFRPYYPKLTLRTP
jgi:predicted nucleic acid-binding protein